MTEQTKDAKDRYTAAVGLAMALNEHLAALTPCDRLNVISYVSDGYCDACGRAEPSGRCQCENDE